MFKKSIFILALFAAIGCVSAQSLQLELNGTVYADGETIQCTYVEEWGEYVQHMQVRNLSTSDVGVNIQKEVLDGLDGTIISFCWGSCYTEEIDVSPRPVTVAASTLSDEDLSFHVIFADVVGHVLVRYTAFNADQPDDKVSINVVFANDGTGASEKQVKGSLGHAYPNPASSVVRFNYDVPMSDNAIVSVYNLLGQEVMSERLDSTHGQASFSVADLNEGIYFCKLTVNGQVMKTEKFIVKK